MTLVRISQRITKLPLEIEEIIKNEQNKVVKKADIFYQAALVQQKSDFKNPKTVCQYHPWNEVFPLFFEASEIAEEAFKKVDHAGLKQAEDLKILQDKALNKFIEALNELKKPKSNESCKPSQASESPSEGKASIEEVLRLLQKMEQDDRQQKKRKASPSSQGGTKPW